MVKSIAINIMPDFLVRTFARPYVAGDSIEKGIKKAEELWTEDGISSTLDLLGEEVNTKDMVEQNINTYINLLNQLEGKDEYSTISLKPTSLGIHESFDYCENSLKRILDVASEHNIAVTIDMEDHNYTDITLDLYEELLPDYPSLGTVLQSRLFRTETDILELPENSRIRICIGIYKEPEDIAYQKKSQMKEKLIEYVEMLIENHHFAEVATHDTNVIDTILKMTEDYGWTSNQLEFQQLLGVPMKETQQKIVESGYTCRLYVPFATDWGSATPYLKRRLDNNPQMAIYVFTQLFKRILGR